MSNEFQSIYLDGVYPMPYSAQRLTYYAGIIYATPWVGLVSGGPVTLNASELLVGGLIAHFSSGANVVTWPDVIDIQSEFGSSISGLAFDYFVTNNSLQPLEFVLGAGMTATSAIAGGDNLIIPAQSVGSFRFIGYDTGYN